MARPIDLDRERTWRQRLHRQLTSGLSIPAFCAREGVSCSAFHAWKRRIHARSLPVRPEPPRFIPLHLDRPLRGGDARLGPAVEIELPHHVRLRFDAPPEPEWLGRVVAALAGLPPQEGTP
jgi:hypothetical protein